MNNKFIGTAVAKKATVKLLDDGNYSLEDKDISIKTGIKINDEKEYQELGTYTIPKPDTEEVSGNTSFTGYDYMKKFDTLYEDNNTYPKRLDDCLESLCQQVGLVLGSKNFPNNSYMIKGNPFTNGETRKTALSNLVQLTGGFAEIDMEDGKLYVRNFDINGEPVETIDGNNYDEFKPNNVFGPVNSVRILMNSGVDGEETIKEAEGVTDENRCQITISDNYYLASAEERELVINELFNALNGLTYLPVELSYYGYPWLKLGKKIKVKDKNDNEFITYVMEHTLKYNGAYSGTIKATALTKTQQAYNEVVSLKQWRRNTELAVDKINGEITQVVQTTETLEEEITDITTTEATATGKNIHIEDSAEEPLVDIVVKGETKQETSTRGINYCPDINEWTLSDGAYIENGYIVLPSANARATSPYIPIDKQQYFWHLYAKAYTETEGNNLLINIDYYDNSKTLVSGNGNALAIGTVSTDNDCKWKFGGDSGTTWGQALYNAKYIRVAFSYNTNYITGLYKIKMPMVTSEYQDEFVVYTPNKPSPDYPSEIENIEGKNKLPISATSNTINGLTFTVNSDDSIHIVGTSTARTLFNINVTKPITLKKTSYVLSKIGDNQFVEVYLRKSNVSELITNMSVADTAVKFNNTYTKPVFVYIAVNANQTVDVTIKLQLEEGTVATEYAPYNSLEFEVVGNNILKGLSTPKEDTSYWSAVNEYGFTPLEDGWGKFSYDNSEGTSTAFINAKVKLNAINLKPNTLYTLMAEIRNSNISENSGAFFTIQTANSAAAWKESKSIGYTAINNGGTYKFTVTTKDDFAGVESGLDSYLRLAKGTSGTIEIRLSVIEGNYDITDFEYKEYQSQTETFPLAEGQKLYEGSYLVDDEVHNKRKQYVITGQEDWILGTQYKPEYGTRFDCNITTYPMAGKLKVLCTHYKSPGANQGGCWANNEGGGNYLQLRIQDNFSTVDELKTYLQEQYSNGTPVIVEYELAKEEIIPYTEEQQEAWKKIKTLHTYKNITNISSTADLDIVYVRDNGLADTYETKSNANQKYKETTEKFAETKMTTDGIKDTVSSIQTTTANNYTELTNKFNDYAPKSDVVTIQKSVEKIQTDTYTKTEINTKLMDGSVTKVSTTAGTFDENGLTIEKTDAKTKGNFNEKGIKVMDATSSSAEELLFAGYDEDLGETIVRTKNINVEKYLMKCNIAREEAYINPTLGGKGIGVFIL